MTDMLRSYLVNKGNFSESELLEIERLCIPKVLKKGQFLLRGGEICRYHSFVSRGCLKIFRLDTTGKEHIIKFGTEGWWVNDRESLETGLPGECYINALEPAQV